MRCARRWPTCRKGSACAKAGWCWKCSRVPRTGRDAGVASAFPDYAGDGLVPVDPLDPGQMTAVLGEALAGRPARISDRLIEDVRRRDALAWATRFLTDLEESQC